jgi:hypothetical protein
MSYPGAEPAFAALANGGGQDCTIVVESHGGPTDILITGPCLRVVFDYIGRYITASGQDRGYRLHLKKTVEKFVNRKGSDIVQEWCGRVGLPCEATGSKLMAGKKLQQDYVKLTDGISLMTGIQLLAQFDGARWYTDKRGTFHYEATPMTSGGAYSVHYQPPSPARPMRSDALRLNITVNVQACQGADCKWDSWHPYDKTVYNGSAQTEGGGGGSANQYINRTPTLQPDQAQQYADAKKQEVSRHQLRVEALCVGDPTIDVTMKLEVSGTDFDGAYQIDTIDHDFGMQGHTMMISASTALSGAGGGWDAWGDAQ